MSALGGYHDSCEEYRQCIVGCSVRWGYHQCTGDVPKQ